MISSAHTRELVPFYGKLAGSGTGEAIHRLWFAGWGFDRVYDLLLVHPYVWLARINRNDAIDLIYRGIGLLSQAGLARPDHHTERPGPLLRPGNRSGGGHRYRIGGVSMILAWLIIVPTVGGLLAWLLGRLNSTWPKWVALAAMVINLITGMLFAFERVNLIGRARRPVAG